MMERPRGQCFNKLITYLILLFCFLPVTVNAAAWLQPKGKGLLIGDVQDYTSCQYWNRQGQLKKGPCFHQFSVSPYLEYGLLSKLTLVLSPNFDNFSQSRQSVPFGFENMFVAGRYALWQKDWSVLSAQLGYNQPFRLGSFGNSSATSSTYALINRQHYIDARLLFGTGGAFDAKNYNTWYANVEGAYQQNFNGAATELHFNGMLGWKTQGGRLVFELQELNALTLHNPRNNSFPSYNLFTVMPNIIYWYIKDKAAVQVGVSQDFYGYNIGMGTAPFIAFWWKF